MSSWHLPAITDGIAGQIQLVADARLKARRGRQPVYDASIVRGRKEKNLKPFWACHGKDRSRRITLGVMDMWKPYRLIGQCGRSAHYAQMAYRFNEIAEGNQFRPD